jgi:hypothetical protein
MAIALSSPGDLLYDPVRIVSELKLNGDNPASVQTSVCSEDIFVILILIWRQRRTNFHQISSEKWVIIICHFHGRATAIHLLGRDLIRRERKMCQIMYKHCFIIHFPGYHGHGIIARIGTPQ